MNYDLGMSNNDLARFVVQIQSEFDTEGIEESDVTTRIQDGRAAIERRPYGFAIIELEADGEGKYIPHLWLLFIDPAFRKKGYGTRFMRELLEKYSTDYHMSLCCHGAQRRKFFGKFKFRIESRHGEMRRMTTNKFTYR